MPVGPGRPRPGDDRLVVAAHRGSALEGDVREAVGRACGLTGEEPDAIRSGAPPFLADPDGAIALRTTASLLSCRALDDDEYRTAVSAITECDLSELTALAGCYATLALQLRVFAGDDGRPKPSAL